MRTSILLAGLTLLLVAATPPRPATVYDADGDGQEVAVSPPVSVVIVAPGAGELAPLRYRNTSDRDVTVTLSARDVEVDAAGVPTVTERRERAASWVSFAEEQVVLQAGTITEVAPAVNVPNGAGPGGAFAVTAEGSGDDDVALTALVAVADPSAAPRLETDVEVVPTDDTHEIRGQLHNRGDGPAVLALRTSVTAWTGRRIVDDASAPLLVLPGATRTTIVSLRAPRLPGPHEVTLVAVDQDGREARATTTVLLWDTGAAVATLATLLVLATAVTWWWVRRRRGDEASATDQ